MDDRPIGIFDSGVGGHVVVEILPRADRHAAIDLPRVAAQDFRLLALPMQPSRQCRRQLRFSARRRPQNRHHFLHDSSDFAYKVTIKSLKKQKKRRIILAVRKKIVILREKNLSLLLTP